MSLINRIGISWEQGENRGSKHGFPSRKFVQNEEVGRREEYLEFTWFVYLSVENELFLAFKETEVLNTDCKVDIYRITNEFPC